MRPAIQGERVQDGKNRCIASRRAEEQAGKFSFSITGTACHRLGPSVGAMASPAWGTVPTLCGLRLANVEAYELLSPMTIHKYEMRCDGEGAGEFRIDFDATETLRSSLRKNAITAL